jgi:hypothetical protein
MKSTSILILVLVLYAVFVCASSPNNLVIQKGTAKHTADFVKRNYYAKRQQKQSAAPIDLNTPIQQNTDQIHRVLTQGSLFLSFPDNGPEE